MNNIIKSLEFTYKEFIVIVSLLGENQILGINNPFKDYSDEEISKEWISIKRNLIQKRYLKQDITNKIKIDKTIFFIIKNCCNCENYIALNKSTNEKSIEVHYYISRTCLIELVEINETLFKINLYSSIKVLKESIMDIFLEKTNDTWTSEEIILKKDIFFDIKNNITMNYNKAFEILNKIVLDKEKVHFLIEDISYNNTLILIKMSLYKKIYKENGGFNFIIGSSRIWLVESKLENGEHYIYIKPISKNKLSEDILSFISPINFYDKGAEQN